MNLESRKGCIKKLISALILINAIIYANAIGGNFISDDIPTIVNNPNISKFSACENLTDVVNWVNYKFYHLNPVPYHLSSITFHTINSVLIFYFLMIFFGIWPSFWGALLFAAHPVHTEAVSWISGKGYLLAAGGIISSFILYLRATSGSKLNIKKYIASVFLCNPFFIGWYAVFYPLMLALYDFTYRKVQKKWKLYLPYIGIASIYLLKTFWQINQRVDSLQKINTISVGTQNPIIKMIYSLLTHLKLLIWPMNLTLYHEPNKISVPLIITGIIAIILMIWLLPLLFRKAKPLFFAVGIFVIFLSFTFSPLQVSWLVAERYLYFPSISFCIFAAFLMNKSLSREKMKYIAVIFVLLLTSAYSVRTFLRNRDWKDRETFWRATAKVSPESPKAHNNMGDIYSSKGDLKKAKREFTLATRLNPNYADAYHNLALTYQNMGISNKAIENYKKAVSINPSIYQSYLNLSTLYFKNKNITLAIEYLKKAIEVTPENNDFKIALSKLEKFKENPVNYSREKKETK